MSIYIVWIFKNKNLHIKYQKEIKDWLKYKDQKRFGTFIEKVIRKEMNKFQITKDEIDVIVDKMFKDPEYRIIYDLPSPIKAG